MRTITVKHKDNISEAAEQILETIANRGVVAFYGEMGAGKTTLIREICDQLNVTDNVTSPTFAIINEYYTAKGEPIYHFDCYRLNKIEEAFDFGCEEYFDSGNLCLIEWPEKIKEILPDNITEIYIDIIDEDKREIRIILPKDKSNV